MLKYKGNLIAEGIPLTRDFFIGVKMKFYHCTSKDLNLRVGDILLAPCVTKNLRETQRKKNLDVVFATCSLHSARKYAKEIQNPIIFEVDFGKVFIGFTHIGNEAIGYRAVIVRVCDEGDEGDV